MALPTPKTQLGDLERQPTVEDIQTPSPEPEEQEEHVSGGLTQTQWKEMIQIESSDEIVGEIIEDLLTKVLDRCLKVDLDRQRIPHTVFWAEKYLTQMVHQQFIFLDQGDDFEEACGTEDCEPEPPVTDSWAEGCWPSKSEQEDDFFAPLKYWQPVQDVPPPVQDVPPPVPAPRSGKDN